EHGRTGGTGRGPGQGRPAADEGEPRARTDEHERRGREEPSAPHAACQRSRRRRPRAPPASTTRASAAAPAGESDGSTTGGPAVNPRSKGAARPPLPGVTQVPGDAPRAAAQRVDQ